MNQHELKQLFQAAMNARSRQSYCMGQTGDLCADLDQQTLEASLNVIKAIESLPIPEIPEDADGW